MLHQVGGSIAQQSKALKRSIAFVTLPNYDSHLHNKLGIYAQEKNLKLAQNKKSGLFCRIILALGLNDCRWWVKIR